MAPRLRAGFAAGAVGSVFPIVFMIGRRLFGGPPPLFITTYRNVFGGAPLLEAACIGGVLFVLSGAAWGMLFSTFVTDPSSVRGMLFGIAPAFWVFVVVAPLLLNQPVFFGFAAPKVIPPLLFNCLLWGGFVGWFMRKALPQS